MKIPLFDIDWTVLDKDPKRNIHHEAFSYAYDKVYGVSNPKEINVEGKIDNQIIMETMVLNGVPEDVVTQKRGQAISAMIEYFFKHINEGQVHPLPGVRDLLEKLKERRVLMGLLTGNVGEIAWGKLEQAGIKDYFDFGVFGDQVEQRVELVEMARLKAENLLGRSVRLEDLVIVGDTPLDIACAKAGKIKSIAVASGFYTEEELRKTGADLIVPSLMDKDKILQFLHTQ
ncbi:MAG: hypothetical protein A3C27_03245 [Candidatus Levybacteria bacterium RIFCSPHIGHO2_02_FULL_39_36]|nr:MAG: Haloacid dehalogenase domain protein hydrolase [Candidatus Levybacteria bacterium GW2011_GWA1_39_11]KKR24960.1 MAG: Haloacid dehalogenase domain protein hydrolase [Candidatus Levybacteria bacterium GW2011_GWB1_39_7]KKR49810.1 MAG: Haloacid dehalogenase domain protein hydrolase [Candidatus Levybacteria bacterium GW2011_GWA2_40_16]OGH25577.1 MAG: hypothetical protein A3E68_00390 [Candidatus Levybacteria bacterium RIFCSPHIGHO2_12_FULL_39_39]OGH28450.1 MAG: hypothetical protein A3C27_03245 